MARLLRFWILGVCVAFFLGVSSKSQAAPDLGVKFPAFKLQALDSQFYGTEDSEGIISVLYFLGHDCAPCVGAGPYLESDLWAQIRTMDNVQFMALDLWNGSLAELNLYKSITGVTFPLLKQASLNNPDYAGARLSDMVVIDQEGYVRLVINGENRDAYADVFNMIASLQNKTPIASVITKTIYYGRTMQVGQSKTQAVKLTNTGAGKLEITGIKTSVPDLVMDPATFTLDAYETQTVTMTFTPMQTGVFSDQIEFLHADRNTPKLQIELIELTVEGQTFPSIVLIQNTLDFGQADLDKTIEKVMTIQNDGPGVLHVSGIQTDLDGLVISETEFTIEANQSKDVTVRFQAQGEGAIMGVIQVMSDDPDHAVMTVSLSGMGVFVPADARTDFDGSGKVEFADFLGFAQHFGSSNLTYDVDGSGQVDFPDFLAFVQNYGKSVSRD